VNNNSSQQWRGRMAGPKALAPGVRTWSFGRLRFERPPRAFAGMTDRQIEAATAVAMGPRFHRPAGRKNPWNAGVFPDKKAESPRKPQGNPAWVRAKGAARFSGVCPWSSGRDG